jgi:magnesium transporter
MVPFQIVGSIFGVNVKVPGSDEDNLVWFFGIILCLLIFTAFSLVTSYRILLRKK